MDTIFFVVCDGIGDRPIKQFDRKTPLEAANTPNLDQLAKNGISGCMQTIGLGINPGSDTAHLALFGYDPHVYYSGRGPFEVAGINMDLKPGDICFRVNVGTVDNNLEVIDRRAGRIDDTSEYAELLNGTEIDGVTFLLKPGTAYRIGMIMRGKGLSSAVSDLDPKKAGKKVKTAKALDSTSEAEFTAQVLNKFLKIAHKKLKDLPSNKKRETEGKFPANYLLVRGAGTYPDLQYFPERYGLKAACIAGAGLYKGIARAIGMDVIEVEEATGRPNSNLNAKVKKALDIQDKYDFIFLHFKAADSLGEDGNPEEKKQFIEKIDKAVKPFIDLKDSIVVITADHSTPCELMTHSADDVPFTVVSPRVRDDYVEHFNERECYRGRLGRIKGLEIMPLLLDLLGKVPKFGA